MEQLDKGRYALDENVMDVSYENILVEMAKVKGKPLVRVRGYKSQKYFDAVSRLKKKSQEKVNDEKFQKVLS
jgi:hypothetical protein